MDKWLSLLTGKSRRSAASAAAQPADVLLPFQLEKKFDLLALNQQSERLVQLRDTVIRQLEILRHAVAATTAIVLWPNGNAGQLSVYACSSRVEEALRDSFSLHDGAVGLLKSHYEVVLCPYRDSSPAIPYYLGRAVAVGSFFAQRLGDRQRFEDTDESGPILCLDREAACVWNATERLLIDGIAQQIRQSLRQSHEMLMIDYERRVLQQAIAGLHLLNGALDTESVYRAAVEAFRHFVEADLIVFSSVSGDHHRISHVSGPPGTEVPLKKYLLEDSLVGQVVKYRRALPETGDYRTGAAVINGLPLLSGFPSVLVVPLLQERTAVTDVLIVAARQAGRFSHHCRAMIEAVSLHVAVKIGLAGAHDQIQTMTMTDSLTGIANRRAFERGFDAICERARRRDSSFSLIVCDIDHFKKVNDSCGHGFGDQVIRQVAAQLSSIVRHGDLAARIGGEEFAVLLEDAGATGAREAAERLRKRVAALHLNFQGKRIPVTLSVGIATYPQDHRDLKQLFSCADRSLYRAKENGRDRVEVWGDQARLK